MTIFRKPPPLQRINSPQSQSQERDQLALIHTQKQPVPTPSTHEPGEHLFATAPVEVIHARLVLEADESPVPGLSETDKLRVVVAPANKQGTVYQIDTYYKTTSRCSTLMLLERARAGHILKTKKEPKAYYIAPTEALTLYIKTGTSYFNGVPVYADMSVAPRCVICRLWRPEK